MESAVGITLHLDVTVRGPRGVSGHGSLASLLN